jgi:hypothetical protein
MQTHANGVTRKLEWSHQWIADPWLQFKQLTARETSFDHSNSGSNRCRMEADQQDAANSTGRQWLQLRSSLARKPQNVCFRQILPISIILGIKIKRISNP